MTSNVEEVKLHALEAELSIVVLNGIGITTASESQERSHGQLHVYDGEGKGKSQAALGVVLRTIGLGICEKRQRRVLLIRF